MREGGKRLEGCSSQAFPSGCQSECESILLSLFASASFLSALGPLILSCFYGRHLGSLYEVVVPCAGLPRSALPLSRGASS